MKTFYVGIKGVIVKDGKVLLLRTNPDHEERGSRWEVAGGRIEGNETFAEALRRELGEELPNIQNIVIGQLLGAHRLHKDIWGSKSLLLIYFRVDADFSGNPELSEEHLEWEWASADRVKSLINDPSSATIISALQDK